MTAALPAAAVPPAARLTYAATTRLVARALGLAGGALEASMRRAGAADLDAVVALRARHLGAQLSWDDAGYLRWRYGLAEGAPALGDLWLLQPAAQPLAIIGTETLRCQLDGQALTGAHPIDLLAEPQVRDAGVGLWLNLWLQQQHDFVVAMDANRNSAGIVARLYRPLPPRVVHMLPLDLRPVARKRLRAGAAGVVGWTGNMVFAARRLLGNTRDAELVFVDAELTERTPLPVPAPAPGTLQVQRSAAYLHHRLATNPRVHYEAVIARRHNQAAGYAAWCERVNDEGARELVIVDWAYDRPRTLTALLAHVGRRAVLRRCWRARLTLQCEHESRAAAAAGYIVSRGARRAPAGVQARDPQLLEQLLAAHWALTDVSDDGDGL